MGLLEFGRILLDFGQFRLSILYLIILLRPVRARIVGNQRIFFFFSRGLV